jgi:hypothetical protein
MTVGRFSFPAVRNEKENMAYTSGLLKYRVQVAKRATDESASFGKSGQPKYYILGTFWMGETFNKGVKSLREGALDAYDTVMFRCRFIKQLDRWCLLKFKGKWYQITSFNDDYQDNQIQITATELANQQVNIVEPYYPSASVISGGSSQTHEVG